MSRWTPGLDAVAIAEAASNLGLLDPVEVHAYRGREPEHGYYYRTPAGVHELHLNLDEQSPRNLSRTLWHELTHAVQCERDFAGSGTDFHRAAYEEAACWWPRELPPGPIEAEARSNEDLDWDLRLVRMMRV